MTGGDGETREEEHHYSEIRGSVGIYQKRIKGALSSREQVYEEKCVGEQEQSEDYLYDDPDHIYFNPVRTFSDLTLCCVVEKSIGYLAFDRDVSCQFCNNLYLN